VPVQGIKEVPKIIHYTASLEVKSGLATEKPKCKRYL